MRKIPPMRIYSWNVNGLRAAVKKDFNGSVEQFNPDVLGLQETKAQEDQVLEALADLKGYYVYANHAVKKGYSGTAILSKQEPVQVHRDMGIQEHDQEGRIITAEYDNLYVTSVYVPNSKSGLVRLEERQRWDRDFCAYLKDLEVHKPVVVMGDFNVAHQEIDIARPKSNYNKTPGYTQQEIDGMTRFLEAGFVDTFRSRHPDTVKYSWWSFRGGAREKNVGWRLDYVLASPVLDARVEEAVILNDIFGSDHCPVGIRLA